MLKKIIVNLVQSKIFKKITFFLGIVFLIGTAFIAFKPEPFLNYGYLGVFIFNLFGAGTLLALSLVKHFNIYGLAFVSALGMAFNDSVAWIIGNSGTAVIKKGDRFKAIEKTVQKYGVFALFIWSLIPFPYDLVGFVAGYLGLSYKKYIVPTFLGKFIRLVLLGLGVASLWK